MEVWFEHPSVIVDNDKLRLVVFKYMKPDPSLPKHLVDGKVVLKNRKPMTLEEYMRSPDGMTAYRRHEMEGCSSNGKKQSPSWMSRLWSKIFSRKEKKVIPPKTFETARKMFEQNAISPEIGDMAEKLKLLVSKTAENGQVALSKRLEGECANILNELVLYKHGLFHYLTEEDAINLLKTADRGIRIDFWNDYPDFVPDDVLQAKKEADSLCVFDNWCVMHYDPDGSTLKQMQAEEWRRDPILFGMVAGSDRLYFVKDWKTDKDDLTIGKVCKTLGIKKLRDAMDYGDSSRYGASFDDLLVDVNGLQPITVNSSSEESPSVG